jgi:UDP-N-acetylglucosamine 2-epimerase (non-hydrolysing)
LHLVIVHTGQHYDYELSKAFFDELQLPDPIVNLEVGSGAHGFQTGTIMIRVERALLDLQPDAVLVPGDTNSALAAALVAAKLPVTLAHLEAGARSYDMKMPEEVNRRAIDHCSSIVFAPSDDCMRNLKREHVMGTRHASGDTLYDAFLKHIEHATTEILQESSVESGNYAILTLHRPENVDDPKRLQSILAAMLQMRELQIILPLHPRTEYRLRSFGLMKPLKRARHVRIIRPVRYREMLALLKHAKLVYTDSGGLQKEAFWAGAPCVTLRESSEWLETVRAGGNVLAGASTRNIVSCARRFLREETAKRRLRAIRNPFGNGNASEKIVDVLRRELR